MTLDLVWMDIWRSPGRAVKYREPVPEDYVWVEAFHKEWHSVNREDYRSWKSYRKDRMAYCRSFLERIASARESREFLGGTEAGLQMAEAEVLKQLSMLAGLEGDQQNRRAYAEAAVEAAFRSKDDFAIYSAHTFLGGEEWSIGCGLRCDEGNSDEARNAFDRAAVCYQRALVYSRSTWPVNPVDVLWGLADVWSECEDTHAAALGLYDWLYHLMPDNPAPLLYKYKCMVIWCRQEVLKKARRRKKEHTVAFKAAESAAANWALRRKKRARADATTGLYLAQRDGNAKLVTLFTDLLWMHQESDAYAHRFAVRMEEPTPVQAASDAA